MSRIGRLPIAVPGGVDVAIDGQTVSVKGPKGSLSLTVPEPISVDRSDEGAVEVLQAKKNIRILECPPLHRGGGELRAISGGLLLQARDVISARSDEGGDDPSTWTLATGEAASDEVLADLAFAWRA